MFDVDRLVTDHNTRIVVCCGAGGVGKTTLAAALAVHAAEAGRRVVVLTIDPARRLAQALGVDQLGNEPQAVPNIQTKRAGPGVLDAMMLDMKRTFDDVVLSYAKPDQAQQILTNPFYQALSSSLAGTQEYMAMEKLSQLSARGEWDLIVVDTPPSRSALDFLDAPHRMARFLDSRIARLLLAPTKLGRRGLLRVFSGSFSLAQRAITAVVGSQTLRQASQFAAAAESMFGGFHERAAATYGLLAASGTAFVVITTAQTDAMREASFFIRRLEEEKMPLAGVVINRAATSAEPLLRAAFDAPYARAAADRVEPQSPLTAAALRIHARQREIMAHESRAMTQFATEHPHASVTVVPVQPGEMGDLAALRRVLASRYTGSASTNLPS